MIHDKATHADQEGVSQPSRDNDESPDRSNALAEFPTWHKAILWAR